MRRLQEAARRIHWKHSVILSSPRFQPPCNAQPRHIGDQYLVFQFAAFEKHTFARHGCDGLHMVNVEHAQFTPVLFLPVGVEVHDHGKRPAFVAPKLVEVFFVKSACFVKCVVKLVPRDAGVAGFIEVQNKTVHEV